MFAVKSFAYDGSQTWLRYSSVEGSLIAGYSSICQSLVLSDPESDTLKNAKKELDVGLNGLLGKTLTTGSSIGAGTIVLAPEGSPLVTSAGIDYSAINTEGFVIKSVGSATYISGKTEVGILRGVFHFLRLMQMGKDISNLTIAESPYFAYRVLDHWWNHYGSSPSVERLYGGDRVYAMEQFWNLDQEGPERTAVITYCRMAASLGLNGITPDGVNTTTINSRNWECLKNNNIKNLKKFAEILNTYGLKTFLSVSYTSPQRVGGLSTSDPANQGVKDFWEKKVDQIFEYIPNFGGFLIKADSENEFGPSSAYGKNQSDGAKPIADALAKHGATLIWRTFIYSTNNNVDFAVTQMETFHNQTWHPNIILRMKDGPRDFQVVEPPNYICAYGGMRHGMELQITQEYTGHDQHICWMVPKWKQVFESKMSGADLREKVEGDKVRQILRGDNTWKNGGGLWGISNISNAKNWTGHFIHQANAYGYGRLAWNPLLTEKQIADEWISCSFAKGNNSAVRYLISDIIGKSWKTYEDYTISYSALMPAVGDGPHYEIGFDRMRNSRFFTKFFMNLANDGIGVDRTSNASTFLSFLPRQLADSLGNIATCPEDYLLFFHHCKWEYVMKSGMTLIQSLYYNHFKGLRQVQRFINNWKQLDGVVDGEIYSHVLDKLNTQFKDAARWVNTFKTDFGKRYSTPIGCDLQIEIPDEDAIVTLASGENVSLSARFADQKGNPVTETINWSVSDGGSIDVNTGMNATFSATADGIYTVTASTATIPDLKDQLQIFVGDWAKALEESEKTASHKHPSKKNMNGTMTFGYSPGCITISAPFSGTMNVYGLNGRVVSSIEIPSPGVHLWKPGSTGKGLYLVQLQGVAEKITKKIIIK